MSAVGNHLLEMDSLLYIFPGSSSTVNINGDNAEALALTVRNTVSKLTLNGLFFLPFRTEPKVQSDINFTFGQGGRVITKLLLFFRGQHREVDLKLLAHIRTSASFPGRDRQSANVSGRHLQTPCRDNTD